MGNEWYAGTSRFVKACDIHKTWEDFFRKKETEDNLRRIEEYLEIEEKLIKKEEEILNLEDKERSKQFYCPSIAKVLRFAKTDLSKIKLVVMGMDPYPTPGVATGRAFEVHKKTWHNTGKEGASLRNILKALYYYHTEIKEENIDNIRKEIKDKKFNIPEQEEWFNKTEEEGVLWLNAALTVKRKAPWSRGSEAPGSHQIIWTPFMKALMEYIDEYNQDIKWALWGDVAQGRGTELLEKDKYEPFKSPHPVSPKASFVESNPFGKTSNIIEWL